MLFPNEIRLRDSAQASLLSAVTAIFHVPIDTLRTAAKRNSFGVSFCSG
jgi:hypothetical protein